MIPFSDVTQYSHNAAQSSYLQQQPSQQHYPPSAPPHYPPYQQQQQYPPYQPPSAGGGYPPPSAFGTGSPYGTAYPPTTVTVTSTTAAGAGTGAAYPPQVQHGGQSSFSNHSNNYSHYAMPNTQQPSSPCYPPPPAAARTPAGSVTTGSTAATGSSGGRTGPVAAPAAFGTVLCQNTNHHSPTRPPALCLHAGRSVARQSLPCVQAVTPAMLRERAKTLRCAEQMHARLMRLSAEARAEFLEAHQKVQDYVGDYQHNEDDDHATITLPTDRSRYVAPQPTTPQPQPQQATPSAGVGVGGGSSADQQRQQDKVLLSTSTIRRDVIAEVASVALEQQESLLLFSSTGDESKRKDSGSAASRRGGNGEEDVEGEMMSPMLAEADSSLSGIMAASGGGSGSGGLAESLLSGDEDNDDSKNNKNSKNNHTRTNQTGKEENRAPSAVTGITGADITLSEKEKRLYIFAARHEHYRSQFPLLDAPIKHQHLMGSGVIFYFEFLKFLSLITFVFAILQFGSHGFFLAEGRFGGSTTTTNNITTNTYNTTATIAAKNPPTWTSYVTITAYRHFDTAAWYGVNIAALLVTFAAGPLFYAWMTFRSFHDVDEAKKNVSSTTSTGGSANAAGGVGASPAKISYHSATSKRDRLIRYNWKDCAIQVDTFYRNRAGVFARRFIAGVIVLFCVGLQAVASYFLTAQEQTSAGQETRIAVVIAIIATLTNAIMKWLAPKIAESMKWQTYDAYKISHTAMLLALRLGNVVAVYAAKDYRTIGLKLCTYAVIGEQFIMILLSDTLSSTILNIVNAAIRRKYLHALALKFGYRTGDQDNLPEFDIAFQFLGATYRHYITVMGMVTSPPIAGLAILSYMLQYWTDKFLVFKVCGRPRRVYYSLRRFLSVILALTAIAAFVTPFAGSIFLLSQYTGNLSPHCAFPG